ncbi:MAG: mucoidy inhibitor MuiA family protein [Bacteroidota bacterium]
MKNYVCILLVLLLSVQLPAENIEKEVKSTIKHVTIFKKGAQVSRTAQTTIPAGNSYIKFTGISPNIDKNSIQVKADGDFTLLAVVHQLDYFEAAKTTSQIDSLVDVQKSLDEEIKMQQALSGVYREEESLILSNKSIGGQQNGVQISELRATADFYRERLKEIKLELLKIDKKTFEAKVMLVKVQAQLKELNANRGQYTSEIVLALNSKTATSADFLLSYVVQNAGWFANYDLRVKDIQSPMQLIYKASVYQTSGEDWKDVKLTLSNGDINQSGIKPTLLPWQLDFSAPIASNTRSYQSKAYSGVYNGSSILSGKIMDEYGEPLIGANIMVKGTTTGASTDYDGNYSLRLPSNASKIVVSYVGYQSLETNINSSTMNIVLKNQEASLAEVVIAQDNTSSRKVLKEKRRRSIARRREKKGRDQTKIAATIPVKSQTKQKTTTVEFKIDLPYTISADGKQNLVIIKQHELPAYYEYYCVPKLDSDAFLTAQVTDWEDLYLLSGEANLFFEGTFVGKSFLNVENIEDTLAISLGRDKSIVVKRTRVKDFTKRQFLGNKKTQTRAWEIEIRNKKSQPINLVIEDQFPISGNQMIEVKKEAYEGAALDEDTGILTWKMKIDGSKSRQLGFRYSVKYPKKYTLILE